MRRLSLGLAACAAMAFALPAGAGPLDNPWLARRVLNIAHQGGAWEAPSNTLFAFKEALRKGTDHLEMDVHATSDGEIVVIHDATVNRTTNGTGRVDSLTLAQVKALDAGYRFGGPAFPYRGIATGQVAPPAGYVANDFTIPTLREVLQAFPDVLINIEIKDTAPTARPYEKALAELLGEFGRGDDTIVVSFLDHATEAFKLWAPVFAPEVSTATGTGETAVFWATAQNGGPGSPNPRYHAMQVPVIFNLGTNFTVVTEDFVRRAHENGLAVHIWDSETTSEWDWLLSIGVDGIMTDQPAKLQAHLCLRGLAPASECP